ncbi:DUF4402 domain-containing protein [Christiangramia sp.]|uniref:DUF4402 domain-containing protein n=1 Tax=Christiangramia sp. TaxID=1931228 RepID=UPI0026178928|nr:DUF4402 domain-containing protein [Christiangramia sp.]
MQDFIKHILISSLFLLIATKGIGQHSASASFTASVNIIEPISLKTTSNMNFASIDAGMGGSVILNPDHTRSINGNVSLANATNVSAAEFEVKGQNGYSYNINVPRGSFSMRNGSDRIIIKDFTASSLSSTLNTDSQIISVGATLEIDPGQKPGIYTSSSPIEIMVSYN